MKRILVINCLLLNLLIVDSNRVYSSNMYNKPIGSENFSKGPIPKDLFEDVAPAMSMQSGLKLKGKNPSNSQ